MLCRGEWIVNFSLAYYHQKRNFTDISRTSGLNPAFPENGEGVAAIVFKAVTDEVAPYRYA